MDAVTHEVIEFLQSVRGSHDEAKLLASHDLYSDGVLDSLSTLNLVHFLEDKFQIRFGPFWVTRKNFSSVDSIRKLVERTQAKER